MQRQHSRKRLCAYAQMTLAQQKTKKNRCYQTFEAGINYMVTQTKTIVQLQPQNCYCECDHFIDTDIKDLQNTIR